MFRIRRIEKKIDLLLHRQTMMMEIILKIHLSYDGCKKIEKKWNKLWDEIMEGKYGEGK